MPKLWPALRRFFQSFLPLFTPPFDGLWLVMLLYFVWAFIVFPHSPILRGNLPDPDDYMYLTQVMDWLKGQGWFDNVQARLDPPQGVPIHFSRLAQLPLAGLILLFQKLGFALRGASLLASFVEPLFVFTGLFLAMRWVTQVFLPQTWAGVTAFIILCLSQLAYEYSPGHVDHHGLVIVIVALMMGCTLRLLQQPEYTRYVLYSGLLMALGMVIALEVLPCVLVVSAWLGFWAVWRGQGAARATAVYGVSFCLGSVIGLILTRAPAHWFELDVLTYSLVYVYLALGIAVSCAVPFIVASSRVGVRLLFASAVACLSGAWFLHAFPTLWQGPYGGLDPAVARIILGEMTETKPLIGTGGAWYYVVGYAGGLIVAHIAAAFYLRHRWRQEGWTFGLVALLLLVLTLLSVFYQRRYDGMAEMVAVIPLALLLYHGYAWLGCHSVGRVQIFAELGLLLLVGPLTSVLIPALLDNRSFNSGVLLFPAYGNGNICDLYNLEKMLIDPKQYGDRPRLILNGIGMGPEILFRTDHQVLSAPFHMNVVGNLDATRFFSTLYPEEAESIVRRRHVDLVVMCRFVPDLYIRPRLGESSPDGQYHRDFSMHMVERLMLNRHPAWLKRVDNGRQDFMMFEVLPPANISLPLDEKNAAP